MSLGKFVVSRVFFMHLLLAIALIALLVFGTLKGLNQYTHHGVSYPVPNLTGLTINEAITTAQANRLKIEIVDSVYNKRFKPGEVVDQQPIANSNVKENRTIFLTVNSSEPEKVALPKLTDISFRQAQVLIENCGLFIGSISYQPSEYNDLVLDVQQDSASIQQGEKIIKGSTIDLIVGRSKGNLKTPLPNLTGFNIQEAQATLNGAKLNLGVLIYDKSITTAEDSVKAQIWKQLPNPKFVSTVDLGSSVDLWLTVDPEKVNEAYEK
ncbi:PASTA domain-containing protein [Prolixibacteraceae bacterium Z1-6]|uniref:PASTA domain-containing protein n=1 Tax=Draconibacterium aestuarii TaxID=2998507 RepID=A0A9X3J579_9BACT|nr:PASTA domain-containing protein [Prolixibacteraceae bacterium Z1-6]